MLAIRAWQMSNTWHREVNCLPDRFEYEACSRYSSQLAGLLALAGNKDCLRHSYFLQLYHDVIYSETLMNCSASRQEAICFPMPHSSNCELLGGNKTSDDGSRQYPFTQQISLTWCLAASIAFLPGPYIPANRNIWMGSPVVA